MATPVGQTFQEASGLLRGLLLGSAAGACASAALAAGLDQRWPVAVACLLVIGLLGQAIARPAPTTTLGGLYCLSLIYLSCVLEWLGMGQVGFGPLLFVLSVAVRLGAPGALGSLLGVAALRPVVEALSTAGLGEAGPRGTVARVLVPLLGLAVTGAAGTWVKRRFDRTSAERAGAQLELERTAALLETEVKLRTHAQNELARAYQGALEGARVKTAFLANMSHELRTPMNAVVGLTDLMLRDELSASHRESLETVRESSQGLLVLLDDLLDLSKIEAGAMRLDSIDFSPRDVLAQLERLLGQRARGKGLLLETAVDEAVPPMLLGDPLRLMQLLTNLAGNSIKFTELGKVQVRLSWEAPVLTVTVTDSGIGMTEAQRQRLFQPFSQADVSTTRRFGGTGLGLAIVKRLCELHGGDVSVTSEPGVGSVFTARLGYQLGKASSLRPRTVSGLKPVQALEGVRVLVAEDNRINQRVAQRLLERIGVSCRIVNNGLEAVAAVAEEPWQIVLMDIQMPELDGIEATRRIRAMAVAQPVIIALSANAMEEDKAAARRAGVDEFLPKPITLDALAETLAKAVRAKEAPIARVGS